VAKLNTTRSCQRPLYRFFWWTMVAEATVLNINVSPAHNMWP